MKKSLIAMAVLAASGASYAQNVTISGTVGIGFEQLTNVGQLTASSGLGFVPATAAVAGSDSSGLGGDTVELYFTAKEDLGGGQSIEAKLGLDTVARAGVVGGDTVLTYTNKSFGRIQMGATRSDAVHSGIPSAGAPVINMDGKLFEIRSNSEFVSYAVPIGPVVLVATYSEPGNSTASVAPNVTSAGTTSTPASNGGVGLGVGTSGTQIGQRNNTLAALYTAGPLQLMGAYRSYDNKDATSIKATTLTKEQVVAVAASYDLGVAKLGFGYNAIKTTIGATVDDMLVGLNVPMGALSIGMTYGRAVTGNLQGVRDVTQSGAVAGVLPVMKLAEGTATGYSIGAKYDLSKRTNLTVKYAAWTRSGYEQLENFKLTGNFGEFGYTGTMTDTSILLNHSF